MKNGIAQLVLMVAVSLAAVAASTKRHQRRFSLPKYLAMFIMAQSTAGNCQDFVLTTRWTSEAFGPNIPRRAGRVNAIAVHPRNDRIVLVATETGGMFRSTDAGNTFSHVPSLHSYGIFDVAFGGPGDVAIAATHAARAHDWSPGAWRTGESNSVWRSTDGGLTWDPLPDHPPHPYWPTRMYGYCVDAQFGNSDIYVGSSRGIAKSTDGGLTWIPDQVFPATANPKVLAVKSIGNGVVLAGGPSGLRRWTPETGQWRPTTDAIGAINTAHAIDGSFNLAFVVNANLQVFVSQNAGLTWNQINTSTLPAPGPAGGTEFVHFRYVHFTEIELYHGNRLGLFRLRANAPDASSPFDFNRNWENLIIAHSDTRCLAWNNRNEPYLLGTDGGLHETSDGGNTWPYTAGCQAGLVALQIMEVNGQILPSLFQQHLYIGTQDNSLRGSADRGVTWPDHYLVEAEGQHIQCLRRSFGDYSAPSSQITFTSCASCVNRISDALFQNVRDWANAPAAVTAPIILAANKYVQPVAKSLSLARGLAITKDLGVSWDQCGSFEQEVVGKPTAVVGEYQTTIYQPIKLGQTNGMDRNGLARIVLQGGTPTVSFPGGTNLGTLGTSDVEFGWYEVFAVDPGNARHLIAADAVQGMVVRSTDGGRNWQQIPGLDQLVTANGRYRFNAPESGWQRVTFVTAISFCPDNPSFVLLGTKEAGVFTSSDRGVTWQAVPGSEVVRPITSFYWRNWNDVIVSTYGRGLWRLRGVMRVAWRYRPNLIESFSQNVIISAPAGLATTPSAHLIYGVPITGARISMLPAGVGGLGAGRIEEIYVPPGGSHLIVSDDEQLGEDVKITETTEQVGFIGFPQVPQPPHEGWIPVAFTYEKDGELAVTYAPEPISFPGIRDQTFDEPAPDEPSPTANQPYLWLTRLPPADSLEARSDDRTYTPGQTILVRAERFDPSRPDEISFVLDGAPFVPNLQWGEGGGFEASFDGPSQFGRHTLIVRQKSGNGDLVDGSEFIVVHEDKPERSPALLKIHREGDKVLISWPASLRSYQLQAAARVDDPSSWAGWKEPIIINGDVNTATAAITDALFFRLLRLPQ